MILVRAVAERSGMNLTDLECITILTMTGPMTAGQLAETMGLTTGAITGVVNRLERAGYVRREKDASDGRRVVIQPLAEKLEGAGAGYFGAQEAALVALIAGYDDRDLAVVLDFARRTNAMTEREIARIRGTASGSAVAGDEFTAPLGSVERGRLVFANGATRLTLRAGAGVGNLCRARFEGSAPKVKAEDGIVTVRYSRGLRLFDWRIHPWEFALNAAVPWAVEVRGGAVAIDADLREVRLTSFLVTSGLSDLALTLPTPAGEVPIRLSGGASSVTIRRPEGVEARLRMRGGVGTLAFDTQHLDGVGGVRLQSPSYDGATDRYDIEISGGAGKITVR